MRVAFVVGEFPSVTETFIVSQVAALLDRGVEVEIFAFTRGRLENVSGRFFTRGIQDRVHYLEVPEAWLARLRAAFPLVLGLLRHRPGALLRLLDFVRHGRAAISLRNLFWAAPFVPARFDLVHAHFGPVARDYLVIRRLLGLRQRLVVTFYGYDASLLLKTMPADYYEELKTTAARFIVMSGNMRDRLAAAGFDRGRIEVIPPGIDVGSYPYRARTVAAGEPVQMISVGRLVEKKGFDDLLRALALLKKRNARSFRCLIVGDGEMRERLLRMKAELALDDVVQMRGFMPQEEIIALFSRMHVFVQPSKTSAAGDME